MLSIYSLISSYRKVLHSLDVRHHMDSTQTTFALIKTKATKQWNSTMSNIPTDLTLKNVHILANLPEYILEARSILKCHGCGLSSTSSSKPEKLDIRIISWNYLLNSVDMSDFFLGSLSFISEKCFKDWFISFYQTD